MGAGNVGLATWLISFQLLGNATVVESIGVRRVEPYRLVEIRNEIEVWAGNLERASQVLAMDAPCFREYARLIQGHSAVLSEDAMIAATARVHGLTVATRNVGDFAHFSVAIFNPFQYRTSSR
jgi:predicted nucleic acid-binding protein